MRISDWSSEVCSSDLRHSSSATSYIRVKKVVGIAVSRVGLVEAESFGSDPQQVSAVAGRRQIDPVLAQVLCGFRLGPLLVSRIGGIPEEPRGCGEAEGTLEREIRSEEHTSELQSLMRISYAVFCLK